MAENTVADTKQHNMMSEYFTKQMGQLLTQLSESFDDCGNTKQILEIFTTTIQSSTENQLNMTNRWHETMNKFYMPMIQNPLLEFEQALRELTGKRPSDKTLSEIISDIMYYKVTGKSQQLHDLQQILFDPSYLLSEMHMLNKWHDPELDDESRAYLVCYILHLNGFAKCNDLIQNKIEVPTELEDNLPTIIPTNLENIDQLSTQLAPALLPQAIHYIPDLYVIACSLYGAGLKGGNLLYHMIDQMLPEQFKAALPLKGMLDTCMTKLLVLQPQDLDGMAQLIQENPSYQKMLSGDTSLISQLDPQSQMMLQLLLTQLTGGGGDAGATMQTPQLLNHMLGSLQQQPQ